jgi:hypothetical protein
VSTTLKISINRAIIRKGKTVAISAGTETVPAKTPIKNPAEIIQKTVSRLIVITSASS